jgi:hypothetical protein
VIAALVAARDRCVAVERRTLLDLAAAQLDRKTPPLPVRPVEKRRRDQDLASRQPVTRIGDHIADRPAGVVEQKIAATTDLAVSGGQPVALGLGETAKHADTSLRRLVSGQPLQQSMGLCAGGHRASA